MNPTKNHIFERGSDAFNLFHFPHSFSSFFTPTSSSSGTHPAAAAAASRRRHLGGISTAAAARLSKGRAAQVPLPPSS
jgi:hypothetical protein